MTSRIHRRPLCRFMFLKPELAAGLLASLLLLAWQQAAAQLLPAEGFFNSGAQFYISNNVPEALKRVEAGRKLYPDDVKLKKLEELLKQQQQQQQQQNQQQQNQQQKDQQQKQDQQKQDGQKQDGQKQDKQDQKPPDQPKPDSGDQSKDESKDQPPAQPLKPGELTPAEAKKLLDGEKSKEQLLQMKPEEHPRNPLRPVKDW